ncbi:hypothetical protein [Streptomyces sp. OR43]|uniref:hypothetical protein n=1 Tax=Streptomyces sp. or43 TaxID=2478957 RepID=UPI0011CE1B1D|nr:hypothetical protein [Streptomyces sp. or43]TXS35048.1 hypothetical protein EAO72_40075 [Streptomyces sp. or43]
MALDGIAEFLGISHGTAGPWPHEPARIGMHATEGETWVLDLTASGSHLLDDRAETTTGLHGPASDLLLTLHGRLSPDRLRVHGDRAVLESLLSRPDLG